MTRRPPRSTQSRSSAASDVYKRQDTIRFGNTFLYVDYSMYLFLGCVFITRNCVQGIGRSQFVLGAGAAELVARIAVCLVLPAAVAGGAVSAAASPAAFYAPVSYTHLRAQETRHDLVCRLLLEKKKHSVTG